MGRTRPAEPSRQPLPPDMLGAVLDIPDVEESLRHLIGQVRHGCVTTYGDLAEALGAPIAARWVGHYALHHPHDASCACHRIVRADGQLGEYIIGTGRAKAARLRGEGVPVLHGRVDLARYRFCPVAAVRPLAALRRAQEAVFAQVCLTPPAGRWQRVAGVDVSYAGPRLGVAAYALVDPKTGIPAWSTTVRQPVHFPYISSFLAFRELPLLMSLLEKAARCGQLADVILVDGSGILHHRHAGLATHLGVLARMPTIGVTKRLLCGTVASPDLAPGGSCPVTDQGQVIGSAMRGPGRRCRPIYVSPGHLVDIPGAERLVRQTLSRHKLPEPLYWADRLSREAASGLSVPIL